MANSSFTLTNDNNEICFRPRGAWTLQNFTALIEAIKTLQIASDTNIKINGKELSELDSSGAMLLVKFLSEGKTVALEDFTVEQQKLFALVYERFKKEEESYSGSSWNFVKTIGKQALIVWGHIVGTISFFGETFSAFWRYFINPKRFRLKELFVQLEQVLLNSLFVVGLVTFLIGLVIAYLFAGQIQRYGANIFIVDGVVLAMSRELSPLIVATVMAGRSGSSFTAQIGAMKLNQEVDAIRILGLSPTDVLVLPRVIALVLSMPLLVFFGDVVGIAGGMILAEFQLDITSSTFLERMQSNIPVRHFVVGLVKAPFFAISIALIGCRMGLGVENNARSVGLNTTSTVVQSIVLVIILDAIFAIIFMKLGV